MSKVYAVKKGKKIGIFNTWAECQEQVVGFSGAVFKSFSNREEAENFIKDTEFFKNEYAYEIYVDGSYHSQTREYSYGLVVLKNGEVIYQDSKKYFDEELSKMRNVAGELKGAMVAMQYAVNHKLQEVVMYYDYEGIAKWCLGEWQTNKIETKSYKKFYDEKIKNHVHIVFRKVKGHSNNKYNDMVDRLAKDVLGIKS